LSSSSYPAIADVHYFIIEICEHLKSYSVKENFSQKLMALALYEKLNEYWIILDQSSTIPTILNPSAKLTLFTPEDRKTIAIINIKEQMAFYNTNASQQELPVETTIQNVENSTKDYFRMLKRRQTEDTSTSQNTVQSNNELEQYLALNCNENIPCLLWWKAHSTEFHILSQIARDYLAVQATSVASEQAFSVASNTLTKIRNRLHSTTARASLCLKSWIVNNLGEIKT